MIGIKERKKFLYSSSAPEIFRCLAEMPSYSQIVSAVSDSLPFHDFLGLLLQKDFYRDRAEKDSIKQMASDAGIDQTKAANWLREIYDAIFELNDEQRHLFQRGGIAVRLAISHGDNWCSWHTSLAVLPREFERFCFYFVKARVGANTFWIKNVEYEIADHGNEITIWLEAGVRNKYREFALDRALFYQQLHFTDVYDQPSATIDETLRKLAENK